MTIVTTFTAETELITIQFEFFYPDKAEAKLSQVLATFYYASEYASPPSPPPSSVIIAL